MTDPIVPVIINALTALITSWVAYQAKKIHTIVNSQRETMQKEIDRLGNVVRELEAKAVGYRRAERERKKEDSE